MSEFNFGDLYFDITKFGDTVSIEQAYPELSAYKDISKIKSEEWKVAILSVDVASPFIKIKDVVHKTEEIFKHLKLSPKKGDKKLFEDVVNYRQSSVIDACTFLIEYFNKHEFASWFQQNKLYYELSKVISVPLNPTSDSYDKDLDRKISLQTKQKTLLKDLKELEANLFGTAAMKADVAYKSKHRIYNWNEKYAVDNQVE